MTKNILTLNQNKSDFEAWLKSLPPDEYAIARNCQECWLAQWFSSQGFFVWGVFPSSYGCEYPNSALLEDPEHEDFTDKDRVNLEDWAILFGRKFDEKYRQTCNRDQALELLDSI
jgi:hypothetical protein